MTGVCVLLALVAELQVAGDHTCPSPAAVNHALADIAPGIEAAGETVHIERAAGGAATVRFRSTGGRVRVERPLPVALPCDERARAAAVIIAAHASAAAPEPVPPVRVRPAEPAPAVQQRLPAAESPPRPSAIEEMEIAALGALNGGRPVTGGRVGVARGVGGRTKRDRLRLSLGYTGTARAPLATGQASWSRAFLALGYGLRFTRGRRGDSFVEPGAELMASALRMGSEGFAIRETHTVFHPGVAAGVRLGQRVGESLLVWAGVGATFWARSQRVFLRDVPDTTRIPRLESWALLGIALSPR